jgi:hypothetical protein
VHARTTFARGTLRAARMHPHLTVSGRFSLPDAVASADCALACAFLFMLRSRDAAR